jgi:hypothetical protein
MRSSLGRQRRDRRHDPLTESDLPDSKRNTAALVDPDPSGQVRIGRDVLRARGTLLMGQPNNASTIRRIRTWAPQRQR